MKALPGPPSKEDCEAIDEEIDAAGGGREREGVVFKFVLSSSSRDIGTRLKAFAARGYFDFMTQLCIIERVIGDSGVSHGASADALFKPAIFRRFNGAVKIEARLR
jgi:hypothetical protein